MQFIPDQSKAIEKKVPFYEDITAKDVPGAAVGKPVGAYQQRVAELLGRLDAGTIRFIPGKYPTTPPRYGYQITFMLGGTPGRFDVAALPLRSETPAKKDRALAQALYLVGNWLEAEVYSATYRPGSISLLPFLVGDGGKTVTEELVARGILVDIQAPMLPIGGTS